MSYLAQAQSDILTGLGNNGPWAAVAGILLWQLLKERAADREERTKILGEVNATLGKLSTAVDGLTAEQKRMSAVLEKISKE